MGITMRNLLTWLPSPKAQCADEPKSIYILSWQHRAAKFGRFRVVMAAGAGLMLIGAAPAKTDGKMSDSIRGDQVAQSLQDVAAALRDANASSDLDTPCLKGKDARSSDLCAQWKAADAAASSSDAAWLFGTLGSLIGLLTLGAAASAAIFAKKAAVETEKGANAALVAAAQSAEANEIARGGDRAWMCLQSYQQGMLQNVRIEGDVIEDGLGFIPVWANLGKSPAVNVKVFRDFKVIPFGTELPIFTPIMDGSRMTVAPTLQMSAAIAALTDNETKDFRAQRTQVALYSRVEYNDIYNLGVQRISEQCVLITHQLGTRSTIDGAEIEAVDISQAGPQNLIS